MKLSNLLAISLTSLVLAGCASSDQGWMNAPLKDTAWQLVTIESKTGNAGRQYVANKANVVMSLRASGDADFTLGCKQGTTSWQANWERVQTMGSIHFEEMQTAATSLPCEPDLVVQRFLSDVPFFEGYVLVQNHLYLNTRAYAATYGWRKIEAQQ